MKVTIALFIVHFTCFFGLTQDDTADSNPLGFIQNSGQIKDQFGHDNSDLLYLHPGTSGLNTQLRSTGFSYDLYSNSVKENGTQTTINRIDIEFVDFNPNMAIEASGKQKRYTNYYLSGNKTNVKSKVVQYDEIVYKNVYANIDVVFKIDPISHGLKYDVVLHPGANAGDLKFKYTGFNTLNLSADNLLEIHTDVRTLTESIPVSYYRDDLKEVDVSFVVLYSENDSKTIGFTTSNVRDLQKTLVIDPVPSFTWGKYIGDSLMTQTNGVITDRFGFVYICGATQSLSNIATAGAYQTVIGDSTNDAYLRKYTSGGTLLWSTYLGGEANDVANDIYVDTSLNVFVAGATFSAMGIADSLGNQDTLGGNSDAFIAKFNTNGGLVWSSYHGGDSLDVGTKLSTDNYLNVYLCGHTQSMDSIATDSSFQTSLNGTVDGFVAKYDSIGTLKWATYIGGSSDDFATGIAYGDTSIYVSGVTFSNNFPVSDSMYQDTLLGNSDGFILKFTNSGALSWATYFGGENDDNVRNVKVFNNNIYSIGTTTSDTNISTLGSFQEFRTDTTSSDAFINKFDRNGNIIWSSYFGGDSLDIGVDLFFELDSNIIACGTTFSTNVPFVDSNSYQMQLAGSSDAFITKISKDGEMVWATYYGGMEAEIVEAIDVYGNTAIYIAGSTLSDTLLIPASVIYAGNEFNSDQEGFLSKFRQLTSTGAGGIGGGPIGAIYHCPGDSVLLTVIGGELGTDADWIWYEGGCGSGPVIATGDSIYVSPLSTTTYYVRAESITNATNCTSVTISVYPSIPIEILADSILCSGTDVLLSASGSGSILWSGPNSFTSNAFDTLLVNVNDTLEGWYYITAIDSFGCSYSDSLNISVKEPPSVVTATIDAECHGTNSGSIAVTGPDLTGYTFEWVTIGSPNDTIVGLDTLNNIYAGDYVVIVTDSNNCNYIELITIDEPTSVLLDTLIYPTACNDSSGMIVLDLDTTYGIVTVIWSPSGQLGDTAQNLSLGWHDVEITYGNGCTEVHSFYIDYENHLSSDIDYVLNPYCEGTPTGSAIAAGLNGVLPYSYEWIGIGQYTASATSLDTGEYVVLITDAAGCYVYDTVTITANHSLQLESFVSPTLCSEINGSIQIVISAPNSTYDITFSNGETNVWFIDSLQSGSYQLSIADTFGCVFNYNYQITTINDLSTWIDGDTIIEIGTTSQLDVLTNYPGSFYYTWDPITYLSCAFCSSPVIAPMSDEYYQVIVTDGGECIDTATIQITISYPCVEVFIPSMFSPNGDQLNDTWSVIGRCIEIIDIYVYDQWGELIFESDDQEYSWDGTYKGSLVQSDQYSYVVNIVYENGSAENFSGFVTVVF